MDVRVKFVLALIGLVLVVGVLGFFVYLSATTDPFGDDVSGDTFLPFEPTPVEPESSIFGFDTFFGDGSGDAPSEEAEPEVLATVTLRDNEVPSQQLNDVPVTNPSEVTYTVHMRVSWSKQLHQEWYAPGAHLSPMVAWSHRLENAVFKTNTTASEGMEVMAETGGTGPISRELRNLRNQGYVLDYATGKRIDAPGEDSVVLPLSINAPYGSVVSMIAPSPDWFITAHNVVLFENGRWLDRKSVPAILYDAGTDSGKTFTAHNRNTNPPEPISRVSDAPAVPIAVFEFVRN